MFLAFVTTGLRYSELRALRWRDVDLIENRLRVEDSKTETGERSIALGAVLAEELWQHRRRYGLPGRGRARLLPPGDSAAASGWTTSSAALRPPSRRAGIHWPEGFRRCHDLRVTARTNDAWRG